MKYFLPLLSFLFLVSCSQKSTEPITPETVNGTHSWDESLPLETIKLPEGFKISVYAQAVENARSMSLSPSGTLFVGTRSKGDVYALKDTDGDFRVDKRYTIATGLNMPNGVAFKDGSLYVAEVDKILRYDDIESKLDNPEEPVLITDAFPEDRAHGWKYIAFGPDDKLYVPVGAPCNICESEDPIYASITRFDPTKVTVSREDIEIVANGVRNTVGFTWHPSNNELWFTENGRDWMGDDMPACELNRVLETGQHFGYPYCHQGDALDPEFGNGKSCSDYIAPVQNLGAHTAPLGIEFYKTGSFPGIATERLLFAEHGSWNRSRKSGYRVMSVGIDTEGNSLDYVPFAEGWLDEESDNFWGRPVDLEYLPDGSLLLSDDFADVIYRISYGE